MKYHLSIRAAYTTLKVSSYFGLKSSCSNLFKSKVVYRFTCSGDQSTSYIGETQRHLFKRISEHTTKTTSASAIFDHLYNCNECQNNADISKQFEILQQCAWYNILTFEALLILKYQPKLNVQVGPSKGTMTSLFLYR